MAQTIDRHAKSNGQGQGRRWIRDEKRLAIMLRDGLACVYCGVGVEDEVILTLDHVLPHSHGGTNDATNLVLACHRCNSARGNRSVADFADKVAGYINHGATAESILTHIETTRNRPLDVNAAKAIIAARGGFTEALKNSH